MTFLIIGLIAYIIVVVTIFTEKRHFRHSFYTVVAHLAVGDISLMVVYVVLAVPCTVTGTFVYGEQVSRWMANLDTLLYNSTFYFLLPLGLNRFFAVTSSFTTWHKTFVGRLFTKLPHIHFALGACWLIGMGLIPLTKLSGCDKIFDPTAMHFLYECVDYNVIGLRIAVWFGYLVPILVFSVYCSLLCVLKAQSVAQTAPRGSMRQRAEKLMLCQAMIIVVATMHNNFAFWVYSDVPGIAGPILMTVATIVARSINPFVYIMFNSTLRGKIKQRIPIFRLCCWCSNDSTTGRSESSSMWSYSLRDSVRSIRSRRSVRRPPPDLILDAMSMARLNVCEVDTPPTNSPQPSLRPLV
uniref:G-protein coupled receptors family 1 profile domain-containing protein n=1 Tax=Plectus sambesii TaxID=2011161 RepID=A0A914URH1_9BILA